MAEEEAVVQGLVVLLDGVAMGEAVQVGSVTPMVMGFLALTVLVAVGGEAVVRMLVAQPGDLEW